MLPTASMLHMTLIVCGYLLQLYCCIISVMELMVTSTEAARMTGVSPSTFRAYVARHQAPQPDSTVGGRNLWSLATLGGWRTLLLSDEEALSTRAEIAKRISNQNWEEGTRRCLAQLGLDHASAQSLIDKITPAGLDLQTYLDARWVLDTRRQLRQRISRSGDRSVAADEDMLFRNAAKQAVTSGDVFQALADLAFALVLAGHAEPLLPRRHDRDFWTSQRNTEAFRRYLITMERIDLPKVM